MLPSLIIRDIIETHEEQFGERPKMLEISPETFNAFREELAEFHKVQIRFVSQMCIVYMGVNIVPKGLDWKEA